MALRTSMWTYPWDVADEGVPTVLDNIQHRGGMGGVNLAISYHSGMFLLPHNPRRKVHYPLPALYFKPNLARYAGLKIRPIVDGLAETDLLKTLREETARRGMTLNAWTVCLHNSRLGSEYPDCNQVTPFGDHLHPQLCPANPHVRAYMRALLGDLFSLDFDAVMVESLEYMPFHHYGYHHEVVGLAFTPLTSWFMGLCFCDSCRQGAAATGVDVDAVHKFVRSELEKFFAGDMDAGRPGITWPEIRALAGGEIGAFHDYRCRTVTSLFEEAHAERPAGSKVKFEAVDFGPLWALGPDGTAWESGFDVRATAPYLDGLHPCPYFVPADQVQKKMDEYRTLAPADIPLLPAIRSIPPQITSADDMREKLRACRPETLAGFTFYNYGFMRYTTLDWIKEALAAF